MRLHAKVELQMPKARDEDLRHHRSMLYAVSAPTSSHFEQCRREHQFDFRDAMDGHRSALCPCRLDECDRIIKVGQGVLVQVELEWP
ncbi:hypothetical protein ACFSHP_10295 [Novosphingobium panipatense]